jgi:hypothetical protein
MVAHKERTHHTVSCVGKKHVFALIGKEGCLDDNEDLSRSSIDASELAVTDG